jgi:lipopolysaccharide export system protein LptC
MIGRTAETQGEHGATMTDASTTEAIADPTRGRSGASRADAARRAAQVAARRHSLVVRSLKIVLPVIAFGAAAMLAGRAFLGNYVPDLKLPTVLFSKDGLTMVEPRLSGRSGDRAYEVTAARAVQSLGDPKKVRLERLDGRVELADKQWAKIEAKGGLYDGTREVLRLEEGIAVTTSSGYRIATEAADLDLAGGRMESQGSIRIDGPAASIEAGKLEVGDQGRTYVFSGGVRMTLSGRAGPDEAAAAEPERKQP